MRRTALAIALSTGALAIPAVALAQGGDTTDPSSTTPVQQQEQQQQEQQQPEQQPRDQQRPDHDCPEGQEEGSGSSSNEETLL